MSKMYCICDDGISFHDLHPGRICSATSVLLEHSIELLLAPFYSEASGWFRIDKNIETKDYLTKKSAFLVLFIVWRPYPLNLFLNLNAF